MDPAFNRINTKPENEIFRVVFFPDRIYHARYLNATRSPRYRYNVREVRGKHDIIFMKGEVFLDGAFLSNFVRIEYGAERLNEVAREQDRFLSESVQTWLRLAPRDPNLRAEAIVELNYCRWVRKFQVELWQTLEAPGNSTHDIKVQNMMGAGGSIQHVPAFDQVLAQLERLEDLEIAFREAEEDHPFSYVIRDPQWDNNFLRSHQEPIDPNTPSAPVNTVEDKNYYLTFQRAFYMQAGDVKPVMYRNAMMDGDNPNNRDDNVLQMRWFVQRELGSSLVYFHQVEIPPGVIEGSHRHIGSEELYYVTEGEGVIYMGEGDSPDPRLAEFRTVDQEIYMLGTRRCKELPARPGTLLFTKSGGIHGIRNTSSTQTLKFVAFGYQTS